MRGEGYSGSGSTIPNISYWGSEAEVKMREDKLSKMELGEEDEEEKEK